MCYYYDSASMYERFDTGMSAQMPLKQLSMADSTQVPEIP